MNIDALIGRIVREFNRQILAAPSTGPATFPSPDPDRHYLLYLHVPYCFALCPFCSFHRVQFEQSAVERYFAALNREIDLVSDAGYRFDELYIGGGTPTVLPEQLADTLRHVGERHALRGISVETNPDHLREEKLEQLKAAGVNRLSVGVQSLDDDLLRGMRRYEKYGSGEQIRERLKSAQGTFDTLNVDMIFNLPGQTKASLQRDLDILIDDVEVDQVSFYPLMSDDVIRRRMEPTMGQHGHEREREYYRLLTDRMLGAGYARTSAWCFSRKPGMFDEYIVDREQYLGAGSGAFSYLAGSLFANTFSIEDYCRRVDAGETRAEWRHDMTETHQMRYYLLMRLFGGRMSLTAADKRFSGRFRRKMWPELAALKTMGSVRAVGDVVDLTENGYYLWCVLMREFFLGINGLRDRMRHRHGGLTPQTIV